MYRCHGERRWCDNATANRLPSSNAQGSRQHYVTVSGLRHLSAECDWLTGWQLQLERAHPAKIVVLFLLVVAAQNLIKAGQLLCDAWPLPGLLQIGHPDFLLL